MKKAETVLSPGGEKGGSTRCVQVQHWCPHSAAPPVTWAPRTILLYCLHKPFICGGRQGAAFLLDYFNYLRVSPHISLSNTFTPLLSPCPATTFTTPPPPSLMPPSPSQLWDFPSSLLSSSPFVPLCSPLVGNALSLKRHVPCLYDIQQLHSARIRNSIEFLSTEKKLPLSILR